MFASVCREELKQYLVLDLDQEVDSHEETVSRLFEAADASDSSGGSSASRSSLSSSSASDDEDDSSDSGKPPKRSKVQAKKKVSKTKKTAASKGKGKQDRERLYVQLPIHDVARRSKSSLGKKKQEGGPKERKEDYKEEGEEAEVGIRR